MVAYEVVKGELTIRTPRKTKTFQAGQVIRLPAAKAQALVMRGKLRPLANLSCSEDGSSPKQTDQVHDPVEIIQAAIKNIEQRYAIGAVNWCRRVKPETWKGIVDLEEQIDRAAKGYDIPNLERLLNRWCEEIRLIVNEFVAVSNYTGTLTGSAGKHNPNA